MNIQNIDKLNCVTLSYTSPVLPSNDTTSNLFNNPVLQSSTASPTSLYRLRLGKGSPSVNISVALRSVTSTDMSNRRPYSSQTQLCEPSTIVENHDGQLCTTGHDYIKGAKSSSVVFNVANQHSHELTKELPTVCNTAASGMIEQHVPVSSSQTTLNARHHLMTGASGAQQHMVLSNDKVVAIHMQPINKQSINLPTYMKSDSTTTSPRGSICSQNSMSSSISVGSTKPPSYDLHSHGDSHASITSNSPRSTFSGPSYDSKRSSITSTQSLFDRHMLSPNLTNEQKTALILHLKNEDSALLNNISEKCHTPAVNQHYTVLSGLQRFNEPAPPPPYDQQSKVLGINTEAVYRSRHQNTLTSPTANYSNRSISISGAKYDNVICNEGISPVEKNLEVLSKQLTDNMNITSPSKKIIHVPSVNKTNNIEKVAPPPPYHGPHHTEVNNSIPFQQSQYSPSSVPQMSPRPSIFQTIPSMLPNYQEDSQLCSKSSKKASLPYKVTPPQSNEPTSAQKKYNELTQLLENEFLNNDRDSEYFGKYVSGLAF